MDSFRSFCCHGFKCLERMSSCNKHAEHDWASLPLLPLWMIKDKLDMFDNLSLSSVCRDWHSMSSSYPKRHTIGDGMPWIMQLNRSILSGARDFVSISRKKKFTLDLPEFVNALLLHSKQGWLLMLRKNLTKERKSYPDAESLFLINPFTRAKIGMPAVVLAYAPQECHGSFSTRNGNPERVVLLTGCFSGQMTLSIAFPGDLSWTKLSFFGQPMQIEGRCGLITIEEKVYYLNLMENMIIYDIGTKEWKELPGLGNENGDMYIMEYGEKIINLFFSTSEHTSHSFYSYNDTEFTWERIKIDDLKETSWYLSAKTSCFSAKDKDLKVNQLVPKYRGLIRGAPMTYGYDIVSHDLINGGRQTLELPWQINSSAKWVDIG
ncbi:F-box/kelch-repeat protein At1g57790 [Daucus carota subsp. sativus]